MKKIYIMGDITVDGIGRALSKTWQVEIAGFNTWLTDSFNLNSSLYSSKADIIVVILSPRMLKDMLETENQFGSKFEAFLKAIRSMDGSRPVFITNVVVDPLSAGRLPHSIHLQQLASKLNESLYSVQAQCPWVHVVDQCAFFSEHGIRKIHDDRFESLARTYYSPAGEVLFSNYLERYFAPLYQAQKKVLAVDLDNTLWGGVIGEDGIENIRLGLDQGGYPYLRFQESLLTLKKSGILLVICSKNNELDAQEVFRKHPDMRLKWEDFVSHRVNWNLKSENLKSIAEELNLGISSFAFFDDSSFERTQMREALPEVDVIEVPNDASMYVCALSEYTGFDALKLSDEDRSRTEMYVTERARKDLRAQSDSLEGFYESLNMEAQILKVTQTQLSRVHQLIQKTNQFNLTTRRYSESDLQSMLAGPNSPYEIYALRLKDKLGENGLTGAIIIKKHQNKWEIDTFLLSCRVIGRTVEYALIRWLAEKAQNENIAHISAQFIPTEKNQVASEFLLKAGFTQDIGKTFWTLNTAHSKKLIPKDYVAMSDPE